MEFFKKRTSFRFMPLRKRWYAISGVLIIASLLMIGIRVSTSASTSPAASCSS